MDQRRRRDQPRLLLHRQRRAGQPAGRHRCLTAPASGRGAGERAGEAQTPQQVYNVAVGDRTTLNDLFEAIRSPLEPRFPHLKGFKPSYRDFRAGDVRHSLADISKAQSLLGYQPSHRIKEGLVEAMDWYVADLV